jgi:DNA-binding NarL/FixJ family response regulator
VRIYLTPSSYAALVTAAKKRRTTAWELAVAVLTRGATHPLAALESVPETVVPAERQRAQGQHLTGDEELTLRLLLHSGHPAAEIAGRVGCSETTVRNHARKLVSKPTGDSLMACPSL